MLSKSFRKAAPKTSSGQDTLSMKLIKLIADKIAHPLVTFINQSLATGIVPKKLKVAKVIPLFKKNLDYLVDNYRPISLLPCLSKLLERVVFNQLYDYFTNFKLLTCFS